ncbi:MAG: S1 RNA-binding domain-containing protein [Phycisphaerales bacterium]|nr:S1 RNA-binding domain-containing protein [Phycisphaerales bacterium]
MSQETSQVGHDDSHPSGGDAQGDISAALNAEIESALGGLTMDDILGATGTPRPSARSAQANAIRRTSGGRQLRTGKVMEVRGKDVLVEFGPKSQGLCPASHFETQPEPGVEIEFVVERLDPFEGMLILAREGMTTKAQWGDLRVGQIVEARCVGMNAGGLDMEVAHHHAFMPAGQVDLRHLEDISIFLGQKMTCEIVELRRTRERMLLSRRRYLERERAEKRASLIKELEVGQQRTATIVSLQPFGAFADIGGVDGLIPISELAHHMIKEPSEAVTVGDAVEVRVIRVDRDATPVRITLSRKRVMADPVITAIKEIEVGAEVSGVVRRFMDFGAFVEIAPGVEGLVHISEISHDRLPSPDRALRIGEAVQVKVLAVDADRRKISLSIKALKEAPVRVHAPANAHGRSGRGGREREEVQPRDADPDIRRLLARFGGAKDLKGGLG